MPDQIVVPEVILKPLEVLAIVALAVIIISLSRRARKRLQARNIIPATLSLVAGSLVNWLIIAFAGVTIMEILGMPVRTVWTGILSVVVMVAIAFFASWSVLSNILSSLLLLTFSKLRMGDIVELRDTKRDEFGITGRVVDLNAFFVTLQEVPEENLPNWNPDPDAENPPVRSKQLAQVQIPNHLFFFRVMRRWPGETSQPLIDAYKSADKSRRQQH